MTSEPTVGRIVHYYALDAETRGRLRDGKLDRGPYAAIIVDTAGMGVSLVWFDRAGDRRVALYVPHDDTEHIFVGMHTPGTWSWPPRVP